MTTSDQYIDHHVLNSIAPTSLKATLDSEVASGYQIVAVVWTGAAFTVVSQKKLYMP